MLKLFRKNTKAIIWSVIVCFVLWGGYSLGTQFQKEGRIAGQVFGKDVSFQEFDRFTRASQIFTFGGKIPEDPERLKQYVWQNIILSREAQREKIKVSDEEAREEVLRLLEKEKISNPTPEIYRRWLQATLRESPTEFEKKVREFLRIQKLIRKINEGPASAVTDEEIQDQFLRENAKISLKLATFPSLNAASNFSNDFKNTVQWEIEAQRAPDSIKTTDLINLNTLIQTWGVPTDMAVQLYRASERTVTEPFPVLGQFAVALVLAKEAPDETKLTPELKEKYRQDLAEQKKYMRFLAWSADLREKANLKDYLPKSESEPEPAPQPEPEPEPLP